MNTEIGKRVCIRRKMKGWTQEKLAEKVGVSWSSICKLETGKSMPSLDRLEDIAQALDMDLCELVYKRDYTLLQKDKDNEMITDIIEVLTTLDQSRLALARRLIYALAEDEQDGNL